MIIENSNVAMSASFRKVAYEASSIGITASADTGTKIPSDFSSHMTVDAGLTTGQVNVTTESRKESIHETLVNELMSGKPVKETKNNTEEWTKKALEDAGKKEFQSLENLLGLISNKLETRTVSANELFKRILEQYRTRLEAILAGAGMTMNATGTNNPAGMITEEWVEETSISGLYAETIDNSFQSAGTVMTADGKTIQFDLSFSVTESFLSYTEVTVDYKRIMMVDPLVINLNSDTAALSDEKFLFDIDADGEKDNISLLSEACGFLALDKNSDGVINDGSELFGANTGDGFAELAVFDLDKNGWIDENDEVFNHLRIWRKDEAGNDKLVALGVQGIGAIYLGNVKTEINCKAPDAEAIHGQVKKTGVFLREDGSAGTIQHVDMAS